MSRRPSLRLKRCSRTALLQINYRTAWKHRRCRKSRKVSNPLSRIKFYPFYVHTASGTAWAGLVGEAVLSPTLSRWMMRIYIDTVFRLQRYSHSLFLSVTHTHTHIFRITCLAISGIFSVATGRQTGTGKYCELTNDVSMKARACSSTLSASLSSALLLSGKMLAVVKFSIDRDKRV